MIGRVLIENEGSPLLHKITGGELGILAIDIRDGKGDPRGFAPIDNCRQPVHKTLTPRVMFVVLCL